MRALSLSKGYAETLAFDGIIEGDKLSDYCDLLILDAIDFRKFGQTMSSGDECFFTMILLIY